MSIGTTTTCSSAGFPPGFQQALNGGTVRVGSILLEHSISTTTSAGVSTVTTTDAGEASS